MLVQFIFAGVVVLILIRVYWRFAKGEIKVTELVFWTAFWVLAGVAFFLPGLTTRVANIFGIGRGADFVFYAGFVLVFYLIFRIFVRLDKIEREITELVRRKALNEEEKEK
jgi:small membrane protein